MTDWSANWARKRYGTAEVPDRALISPGADWVRSKVRSGSGALDQVWIKYWISTDWIMDWGNGLGKDCDGLRDGSARISVGSAPWIKC
jgi:hypothetical protein